MGKLVGMETNCGSQVHFGEIGKFQKAKFKDRKFIHLFETLCLQDFVSGLFCQAPLKLEAKQNVPEAKLKVEGS